MTRRQRYFVKQKAIGLLAIVMGVIFAMVWQIPAYILLMPVGLVLLFTKKMVWIDDYYYEMEERRERR